MIDDGAASLPYSRHTIEARECQDVATFVRRLQDLGDVIAVNVIDSDGTSAAFCSLHLRAILETAPETMIVETIPAALFVRIVIKRMALTEREALALRLRLRVEFLADTAGSAVLTVRRHVDQLLLLLDGFALQRLSARLQSGIDALVIGRESLGEAVAAADNVLGMDSLQHDIVPALRLLTRSLS